MEDSELRKEIAEVIYGVGSIPQNTHLPDVEAIMKIVEQHTDMVRENMWLGDSLEL